MKRYLSFVLLFLLIVLGGCNNTIPGNESITIKGKVTIGINETTTLTSSNSSVLWESLDDTIASVNQNGEVTGHSVGSTYIRASLLTQAAIFDQILIEVKDYTSQVTPPINPDKVSVKLGIDLIDDYLDIFAGKRVGLITNATGINSNYESTIDILYEKVNLVALYAPEHGIRGDAQAGDIIGTVIDPKTQLPIYSLYGSTQRPTKAMLEGIDIMCIDLQDAGARFYTYICTMAYAMEECSEYGIEFVVFDRPNPIGGYEYEGNILDLEYRSFIGYYPILQRHGMTIAELALLFNEEYDINLSLYPIKMEGWKREYYYDDTSLPWVIPSPNFPSIETAVVYPGTCIFEGTNLSEGRGTTIPFQVIGAPWINAEDLADALNAQKLPGVVFRPTYFTPTFSKHSGVTCAGVQVHVTNRLTFKAVKTGWTMLDVIRKMYPQDFQILNKNAKLSSLNLLTGTNYITKDLYTLKEQYNILLEDSATFNLIRKNYLLYPYSE